MLDPLSQTTAAPQVTKAHLPQRKLLKPSDQHPDDYVMEMDYSSISSYMECPRKSENLLVRGRELDRDRSATDFGGLFHTLEELRLRHGLTPEVRQKQQETIALHFLQHPVPPTDHRTADTMTSVLHKYNTQNITDGWTGKVLQVNGEPMTERPFKVELCTVPVNAELPYYHGWLVAESNDDYEGESTFPVRNIHVLFTGRIDTVLTEGDMLWVTDHKTSSRGGKEFEEAFRLSLQTRGYCWAAQKLLDVKVAGLLLNGVIVRPPTKTGKGTEFIRRNFFYSQDSIEEWYDNMRSIVADFISSLVRGYFPQHARSFISPCAKCDYSENCTLPRNQRAADLASELYRDVTWSPMH